MADTRYRSKKPKSGRSRYGWNWVNRCKGHKSTNSTTSSGYNPNPPILRISNKAEFNDIEKYNTGDTLSLDVLEGDIKVSVE